MASSSPRHSEQAARACGLPERSSSIDYRAPRVSLTLADFDIIRRIGDGSYSEVMQVRHKGTGVEYAIKMVDKHLIVRHRMVGHIKQERNILDECDHPGIARLYFTFQDEASLYLGLELCPNGELYDQIRLAKRLPLPHAQFYAAEIVLMLEYLQEKHVVHRDLKPENLLLDAQGHLKLIDFGSAFKLQADGQEAERAEGQRKTSLVGTADYVAPEVLSNEEVSTAVDLWALGCIIFQMLVGKPPFKAASEYLTFQRIAACEYSIPAEAEVPPDAQALIRRLLVLEPSQRLGAGRGNLQVLKTDPFFAGISWDELREHNAPAFAQPQHPLGIDEVGLDWEMTSMLAALPVQYSSHTGSAPPILRNALPPLRRTLSPGQTSTKTRSRSSLSLVSHSDDRSSSPAPDRVLDDTQPQGSTTPAESQSEHFEAGSLQSSSVPAGSTGALMDAPLSKPQTSSVRRLSPFAADDAQDEAVASFSAAQRNADGTSTQ